MISRTLEFDSGECQNFIGSMALARNQGPDIAPPLKVIGGLIESPLYEDIAHRWSGSGFIWDLFRRHAIPDSDQINRGVAGPQQSISISNPLASGIYRLYFRFRGVAEQIPFITDPLDILEQTEGQLYKFRYGLDFFVSNPAIRSVRYLPGRTLRRIQDPEWFPPFQGNGTLDPVFLSSPESYGATLILNGMIAEGDLEQKGVYYLDRIVAVSAQGPVNGNFTIGIGATGPGWLRSVGFVAYNFGGTTEPRFFVWRQSGAPSPPLPSPIADPGTSLFTVFGAAGIAYYRNSAGSNPARLDTGTPMLVAGDGDPAGDLVGQIQYLGARPDTELLPESYTELSEPILLTSF